MQLRNALVEFGFSETELPVNLFEESGNIITFGIAPVRIGLLNEIDGIEFAGARRGRYGNIDVYFIGKRDLLENKKSTKHT